MEIKLDIFFFTAQLLGGGALEVFIAGTAKNASYACFILTALPLGAYSSGSVAGQSVDFVRLLYIIWLWASLLIWLFAKGMTITTCYV